MAVVVETATKPSRFANFWQGAESLVPATQNDIRTSKSAPSPQFFPLLTSKCASRHNGVHFSDVSISKVLRTWCVLHILTWKCASRHNGVQFFISHLATWLRTRRFSEPTFRPSGATNHWKNKVNRDLSTFSHTCIFSLLTLSLL